MRHSLDLHLDAYLFQKILNLLTVLTVKAVLFTERRHNHSTFIDVILLCHTPARSRDNLQINRRRRGALKRG
jgi:hypothetical protein